jgi:hypothetical protein
MHPADTRRCPRCATQNPPYARFCKHCRFRLVVEAPSGMRYGIVRVIKSGGMGAVYAAEDAQGRRYAVKELLDRVGDESERQERITGFLTEADLLKGIVHPQIPQLFESWSDPFIDQASGERRMHYYLVLEYIDGEDLEQRLEREGAQSEARVLRWAANLCDVLSYLHHNDLIYRDLKPSNIMITGLGDELKLIDFGIVMRRNTRGTLIGTPGYSPPEQYQGFATQASDIYALGATLHHLLSGRDPRREPPFSFPPLRQLNPSISPQVEAAVMRALELNSVDRWGSVEAFRAALIGAPRAPRPAMPPARRPTPAEALARPDAPAPTPTPAAPRAGLGRRLLRWLRSLLLIALLVGASAWLAVQRPDLLQFERYLPALPAPSSAAEARAVQYELEVTAQPNSDQAALRALFELAFDERLRQELGPGARREPASALVFEAEPALLPDGDPLSPRYRVRVSGVALVP